MQIKFACSSPPIISLFQYKKKYDSNKNLATTGIDPAPEPIREHVSLPLP